MPFKVDTRSTPEQLFRSGSSALEEIWKAEDSESSPCYGSHAGTQRLYRHTHNEALNDHIHGSATLPWACHRCNVFRVQRRFPRFDQRFVVVRISIIE